ncbi:MAG: hypothetical protein IKH57_06515 [Clostridia bacterium]|nr:hypothetical protein [Clostridia bacterium]
MQTRRKLRRFAALVLTACMALACMPVGAAAEDPAASCDGVTVEVIPAVPGSEPAEDTASDPVPDVQPETEPAPETQPTEPDVGQEDPADKPAPPESIIPEGTPEVKPDETPETEPDAEIPQDQENPDEGGSEPETASPETDESVPEEPTSDEPSDDRPPLKKAIETYGHVYVATVHRTRVYSSPVLKPDTLVYTTTGDIFLVLATAYTDHDTIVIWFLDEAGDVVKGFVSANDLDDRFLLDDEITRIDWLPLGEGKTAIGVMVLFTVNGSYPEKEEDTAVPEPVTEEIQAPPVSEEAMPEVEPQVEPDPETDAQQTQEAEPDPAIPEEHEDETSEAVQPELPEAEPEPEQEPLLPVYAEPGAYIRVTTKTRVFGSIDPQATDTRYSAGYIGNFVKDATVQVLSVGSDENGSAWYQVRYLYGADFADGRMKWTDYGTAWVLETETEETSSDSCTVTDFAYTLEYLKSISSSGRRRMMAASPMNGFSLRNAGGGIGNYYAGQTDLHGTSGRDREYPQLAKSAAHGLIYATPHYLDGNTVFCLEHTLNGPGEGSGASQTATGPYTLVDLQSFVENPAYGGTTGVRYRASTMHALGWVLRHTYPFMELDRSDANNSVWSRVAGQFAMREVIKQLEGPQYVRDYWDMDSFYSFTGGAPAVYLTYARWLAENAIAYSRITGDITASDRSLRTSGSDYIGTVTLTTDADRIRIPRSVGTITGNSGGSDGSYYYVKSGDTIQITSFRSSFSVPMESMASDEEEARFLVGVPSATIQKIMVPIYGQPYILKSGSLSFELNLGEIVVVKRGTTGDFLMDAEFELLNDAGQVVATASTDYYGQARFSSLEPGHYTLRETREPVGYLLAAEASQEVTVEAGGVAVAQFYNEPIMGRIRIMKTDIVTGKPLPGAVFTVTLLTPAPSLGTSGIGKVVATITTDDQGIAETDLLPWGEYQITESGVPEGYLDSGYTTTVWIK